MKRVLRALAVVTLVATIVGGPSNSMAQIAERRVWTVKEILEERQPASSDTKEKWCQGQLFKPCLCPKYVSKLVQYRPSVSECGGKAAIILSGKYLNVFSVVVRDLLNRDRWPAQGVNGCSAFERDTLGLNKCSVFKVQKVIGVEDPAGDAEVHCLGASGYSTLFKKVTRITAKLADHPNATTDPLERLCLVGPNQPLN